MRIEVDTSSPVPAYEQIRAQVETMAHSGVLPVGTMLPTIRQLAADLGLAANTVARAYRELEHSGTVSTRVRHGTVIAANGAKPLPKADRERRLSEAAGSYVLACRQLGVEVDDAVSAVRMQYQH